jgi:hypothetical protein
MTFNREERYIVTKIKTGKSVDCVVVEKDWPEYEIVWKMLQDRVEGRPNRIEQLEAELAERYETIAQLQRNAIDALKAQSEPVGEIDGHNIKWRDEYLTEEGIAKIDGLEIFTTPQPSAEDAKDAARWRYAKENKLQIDFDTGEIKGPRKSDPRYPGKSRSVLALDLPVEETIDAMLAERAKGGAPAPAASLEEWKLVPKEATGAMELCGGRAIGVSNDEASVCWIAMLAAAPKHPESEDAKDAARAYFDKWREENWMYVELVEDARVIWNAAIDAATKGEG